jgi:DNA repair exonuclease SbcCD ATPase subunit
MIIFKTLKWDNCFSYADGNVLKLDEFPIVQLIGTNGVGKTSISLILQEVLYGKNIKAIKKQDIINRYTGKKGYHIELEFDKDNDSYKIILDRKSSLKLFLYKNGEDISSHTSINTYKTIGDIIGISEFKTFIQLLYQSSTDSLEFLTATDTTRKRFLISLLQLAKYTELHEIFKKEAKNANDYTKELNGAISHIMAWLEKHESFDFTEKELDEVPELENELLDELSDWKADLANVRSTNFRINNNNEYIRELENLDLSILEGNANLNVIPMDTSADIRKLEKERAELVGYLNAPASMIKKLESLDVQCPTCLQPIDPEHKEELISQCNAQIEDMQIEDNNLRANIDNLKRNYKAFKEKEAVQKDFERLHRLIDESLTRETLNKSELEYNIKKRTEDINTIKNKIQQITKKNTEAAAHNSKIKVILEQIDEFREQLEEKLIELQEAEKTLNILELLKMSFSTNGLISYKIESSVKELESVINEYLAEFGHFQIYFKLAGEKLNIEVVDNEGNNTGIESLSSGERARVNIATVLAIRKIMTSLTSTKINLLFLDEIVGVIDEEGKEKLAEILLKEKLNTFMVSHEWEHPLIEKIHVEKEDNISRIEHG